ncbi:MAG TPA: pyridoxamine 5'-phosphate oxidase [Puia sp.]|jgi:pyridoxamine 5'-phosphate oxidase|nr:pyridoxamine 5'-phosphate oxidase [Puia sp.]
MSSNIADIRKEYKLRTLSEQDVDPDPFKQFDKWWQEAIHSNLEEVNAMTLATATADGMPDARIVLLKGFDEDGFTFFTNYDSAKGRQLLANPRACLVFFWAALERQVRIGGLVTLASPKVSDDYFNSRPEGSRIGAWASPQSQVIESREWLEENEKKLSVELKGDTLHRPPHWGGYVVKPTRLEFWQGRPSRLHDRILYTLRDNGHWMIRRLAP